MCINSCSNYNVSGCCYHSYSSDPIPFDTFEQMLFCMEDLFNQLMFPFPSTNERRFEILKKEASADTQTPRHTTPKKREKTMKDEELLMHHGDLGSFIIRVQHRQNSSWQGRLTWVEKNQTISFRSIWEMIKLIEDAINMTSGPQSDTQDPAWKLDSPESR